MFFFVPTLKYTCPPQGGQNELELFQFDSFLALVAILPRHSITQTVSIAQCRGVTFRTWDSLRMNLSSFLRFARILVQVALVEEVRKQDSVRAVHDGGQVEEVIAEHARLSGSGDTPRDKVDKDTHEHLREL